MTTSSPVVTAVEIPTPVTACQYTGNVDELPAEFRATGYLQEGQFVVPCNIAGFPSHYTMVEGDWLVRAPLASGNGHKIIPVGQQQFPLLYQVQPEQPAKVDLKHFMEDRTTR